MAVNLSINELHVSTNGVIHQAEQEYTAVLVVRVIETISSKKAKQSLYRPGVVQRVGRGIALLFHGRCTRRG